MWRVQVCAATLAVLIFTSDFAFAAAASLDNQPQDLRNKRYVEEFGGDFELFGGCETLPDVPINGNRSCSIHGHCQLECLDGYKFPQGERDIAILCRDRKWKIQNADYAVVPHCEPICLPECNNQGICINPNECNCPENFSGPRCQYENKPCLERPQHSGPSRAVCDMKTCTVMCEDNFVFPDGSSVVNLICKHGKWEVNRSDWVALPECKPVCNPRCQNGGICLPLNSCQCPTDFRGPQCQYASSACDVTSKLSFNGESHCSVSEESIGCSLRCPEGQEFEFPAAASYVCRYESGAFEPQPIPQCKLLDIASRSWTSREDRTSGSWTFHRSGSKTIKTQITVNVSESFGGSIQQNGRLAWAGKIEQLEKIEAGSCFSWAGAHYKSFDGRVYSFESSCAYTLVKETRDDLFSVSIQNDPQCSSSNNPSVLRCPRVLRIFVQDKEYSLLVNSSSGQPELRNSKGRALALPSQLTHLRVEAGGKFLVASLEALGLLVRWDGLDMVQLEASESLWNRTAGLCGNLQSGPREQRSVSASRLASSWKIDDIGEKCEERPSKHRESWPGELKREAFEFCSKLLADSRYKSCAKLVDFAGFVSSCEWDYCSCGQNDRRRCACSTMEVYVRQCAHRGVVALSGWRDSKLCPLECDNGKIYMACGPKSQASCGAEQTTSNSLGNEEDGEEGCFCPAGSVLHEGRCIAPGDCPCRLRGKWFSPGSSIKKDCNGCSCLAGRWLCTESQCAARCSAVGDPHYTTFDGKRYDFMGKCTYYLVRADNYSVEAENSPCSSAISEMMGFARTYQEGEPSCTRTVTVRHGDLAVKLKQNRQILVNGEDVTKLPMLAKGGVKIRLVSSIFTQVLLPNGLEVLWDGVSRVYVNAPAHFRGKTKGLCGTFTANQKDDFLTPDGDVEQAVVPFANKWKTSEQCADVKKESDHPCDLNPQKRAAAEKYCSALKKKLFLGCHWYVDPEPFYSDCVYDMCACVAATLDSCLCPSLAAYAKECAEQNVSVPWREEIQQCRVHCPGDQEYQVCGSSCMRSCADISFHPDCREECVEGCNCPAGQALDASGECIPVSQCPCVDDEIEFLAGYKRIKPSSEGRELCTCRAGRWECRPASADDATNYPGVDKFKGACSATGHQELSTCEPSQPRSCRNMHEPASQSPAICRPGCVCRRGYVLDAPSGQCVEERQCPCYHGGRSYKEGALMQEECNTCACSAGKWNCTDNICPGVCSVWGDSHYKTFDDRQFDFQGVCDYVLAKGELNETESFSVSIRNVACGTTGVTCSKSITLTIGNSRSGENSFTLTRGKKLTAESFKGHGKIAVRRAGLFVFLDVPDLGLVLQWDEGTRLYLRLDSHWQGRTAGLCGDYNGNAADDFKTPAGGVPEASARLFADSWKMSELCAEAGDYERIDTCARHPERRLWAESKCRIMKSAVFGPCHSEVEPDTYIQRCVSDACGCDDGGDCECLCTAIAAYKHECSARGVHIKWRTQKLCPMQCDESCSSYSACVSTCPRKTCDNLATITDSLHLCNEDSCVEGCEPKGCPPGQVYQNATYSECVPLADCKTLCKVVDGVEYYEGDKLELDDCQTCFCSRGKLNCHGTTCPQDVTSSNSQPPSTMSPGPASPLKLCALGEQWIECAIRCSRTCSYFRYELRESGRCSGIEDCLPGCVPEKEQAKCLVNDYYWNDWSSCVQPSQCICRSDDSGERVPPGPPILVTDCKSCQCLDDHYSCLETCAEPYPILTAATLGVTPRATSSSTIVLSTVTPPRECDGDSFVWLIERSPDARIAASSYDSNLSNDSARLGRYDSFETWRPASNDGEPWLEVRFDRPKPVYGIVLKGDGFAELYVTSYELMYSLDGHLFSFLTDANNVPKLLRGPNDGFSLVREIFHPPIEAKVVKFLPIKWHTSIAMQIELLDCEEGTATETPSTTPQPIMTTVRNILPDCDDPMGYETGDISDQQVTVSSSNLENVAPNLRLTSLTAWRPQIDNPSQYVQFDFLEPRKLTGLETMGGNGIWTTAYIVKYSSDGQNWIPVTDGGGAVAEFLGNDDDYSGKVNHFARTIRARYLRVHPTKWHRHIGLKLEVHGCYLPYPTTVIAATTVLPTSPSDCNLCQGVQAEIGAPCHCNGSLYWDGKFCLTKQQCPCVVDHTAYPVGWSYETADCQHCQCALGGVPHCQRKVCPECASQSMRPVLTKLCGCECKPCRQGQRLCPGSKVCIDDEKWCDGVQDCADDEINCPSPPRSIAAPVVPPSSIDCPSHCPPGYMLNGNLSIHMTTTTTYTFTFTMTSETSIQKEIALNVPPTIFNRMAEPEEEELQKKCPEIECVPVTLNTTIQTPNCPKISCPEGFKPKYDQSKSYRKTDICDNACIRIPPKERVCDVVGKTFVTFDQYNYKYEICKHILARDRQKNDWVVIAEKVCTGEVLSCSNVLVVLLESKYKVVLHPDMHVTINGIAYSPNEVKHLDDKHPALKLSRIGDALRLESRNHPFWVMIESSGAIKIGVSEELFGYVDGMCGFMDGVTDNDLSMPNGALLSSSQLFGDSWKTLDRPECMLTVCPKELQDEAWKMCNLIKDASFEACDNVLNREQYVSSCIESSCGCLSVGNTTSQECRCRALTSFVGECLAASKDQNLDLSSWRSAHDCPAVCRAPFVHKECFRNKCEVSCENLRERDPCPVMDKLCVAGCFCPDGLVRSGDGCVPPSQCRDCVCEGFGSSRYVSFDRNNLNFNGNCTFTLSRDVVMNPAGKHVYQVFISNSACEEGTCTESITLLYQEHLVQVRRAGKDSPHELRSLVDWKEVVEYPVTKDWLKLTETANGDLNILIPAIQLEISCLKYNLAFALRLPSHTFGGAMEGLCGNCNNRQPDDFKTPDGKITEDTQEFGDSWRVKEAPTGMQLNDIYCKSEQPKSCTETPPTPGGVCERLLLEDGPFGRCHGLVTPDAYFHACRDTLCQNGQICANFEAYARACASAGVCVDWRELDFCAPMCPYGLVYQACKSGCPETCENLESHEPCLTPSIEGCFCPDDQIWRNGSCVPKRNCYVCDEAGHLEGDVWQQDKCTKCSCKNRRVTCQQTSCPATICGMSDKLVPVPGFENECCQKFVCVPNTTPTPCSEAQQPECGFAQTLKITTDSSGCQQFICQCVPEEECSLIVYGIDVRNKILEPGFVEVTNNTGCCPKIDIVCKPETCPGPSECLEYHKPIEKEVSGACCPVYECEPPRDLCLYDMDSSNDLNFIQSLVPKRIGETWMDGSCKKCNCILKDSKPIAQCTVQQCSNIRDHFDINDYVLKEVRNDECCPTVLRTACKQNDRIYQVGESWLRNPEDTCMTTKCTEDDLGRVTKSMEVQTCNTTCEFGYKYRPSPNKSERCCGDCIPTGCVVDGELKEIGETWYSTDNCVKSSCLAVDGSLHVQVEREACKNASYEDADNYKFVLKNVIGKCCPMLERIACLSDGQSYEPGESWISKSDSCILESCSIHENGLIEKEKQIKTCNTDCPKGWEYQRPEPAKCCGECKQVYCIIGDNLYEPGKTWHSSDNCTTYSCNQKNEQLYVSATQETCPELNCDERFIQNDGCCKKCNVPILSNGKCEAVTPYYNETIRIIIEDKNKIIEKKFNKPVICSCEDCSQK